MTIEDLLTACTTTPPEGAPLCGHRHPLTRVDVELEGLNPALPDAPPIPQRLATGFKIDVYDQSRHDEVAPQPGYCHSADAVSWSIINQGTWEPYETSLMLDVLQTGDNDSHVIDFGAHVGWFSLIAASWGYPTIAIEGDPESVDLVRHNADINGCDWLKVGHGWVTTDQPNPVLIPEHVRYLKIDIEGADPEAVYLCEDLFRRGGVDVALIEISPCFRPGPAYPDMVQWITTCGYRPYKLPDKSDGRPFAFGADPLAVLQAECELSLHVLRETVAGLHQANFVFLNRDRFPE